MSDDYKAKFEALVQIINNDEGEGIYPCGHLTKEQRQSFKDSDGYKCGWNDAIIDGETKARKLLAQAEDLDNDRAMLLASGWCFVTETGGISLNMNDIWGWACSWIPGVPNEQVKEVARLFRSYGRAGLMYWHSCQENDMRSEFADNNRAIDFVRHEERIRKEVPDHNRRAFHKEVYSLGDR